VYRFLIDCQNFPFRAGTDNRKFPIPAPMRARLNLLRFFDDWSGRRESNSQPTAWKAVGHDGDCQTEIRIFFQLQRTSVPDNTK
jgi:hypothetical protein